MEVEHPGFITNDDIIQEVEYLLEDLEHPQHNIGLKENLLENDHYYIVNDLVWNFVNTRYGGIEILRVGTKRSRNDKEPFIEVNLLQLNIHYFPEQQNDKDEAHVYTVYTSRYATVGALRERLAELKDKQVSQIRLWKSPMPSDFEQFYRNNLCEWRKHREIKMNAQLLKDKNKVLDDIEFSMDDFLIVECKVNYGFIFEEIDKPEDDDIQNDNMDFEEMKDQLSDASSLEFLNLDVEKLFKKSSNAGLNGLGNLGNTCFMNSALQCMSNTFELTKYFLFGLYKDEINYNNPLGTKGRLAQGYAKLMKELWISSDGRVTPWDVKKAIGTVAYQFQGFAQQDSFELFNYVADTLHEDLNRVKEKPCTEFADSNERSDDEVSADHWKAFTDRNQSVIVDLMYGQLKSRLHCTVCDTVSNTFDPFLALSVPIPKNKLGKISIVYFPASLEAGDTVQRIKTTFEHQDTVKDLCDKLSKQFKTENDMVVYNFRRRNILDERISPEVYLSKLEDEKIAVYEYSVPTKKGCCIVPVSLTKFNNSMFGSSNYDEVCEPMVFVANLKGTVGDLRRQIFSYLLP